MSSHRHKVPIYQLIATLIEERILSGHYKPGQRIPAIREVAAEFECNKLTVQKAFDRLNQRGLIEKVVGSGSYVKYPSKIHEPGGFYDFRTDYLAESFFPHKQAQRLINALFENEEKQLFVPPPTGGDTGLIQVLSQYYEVPAERMLIISGAQQGLDLVAKVFGTQLSESVLFEDPTYPGAITLFKARHFVPLEDDGPDKDQLDKQLNARIRLFYAIPSIHNPLGIEYSPEKKNIIADRALNHPFYIIEDDYLGELRNNNGNRFIDLCPERAIYIKSLSQTTVAGIRLGFMVVPEDLLDKFIYAKFSSDITSFVLLQKFVREFIKGGYYSAHLDMIKEKAARRKRQLIELADQFDFLTISCQQDGFNLWVQCSTSLDLPHVPWCRGEEFSFSNKYRSCFRLSYMHLDDKVFDQGLQYLKELWARIGE
ncbi:MAG: PLP-dependent aminotransferase family protein [Desulfobacteraceae bacterium]|nr:PLP-dependent aminotransferase family protein [Desulfobacteraceae bacterium]